MNTVKSRFNYLVYIYWVIVILAAGFAILLFINPNNLIERYTHIHKPLILGVVVLAGCALLYLFYIANFERVFIFNDRIVIKSAYRKTVIEASEIKNINLFAHDTTYLTTPFDTMITRIKLIDGKKINFIDLVYRNGDELKLALKKYFREKIIYLGGETKRPHQLSAIIGFEKYTGNPYINIYSLVIFGLFIVVLFNLIRNPSLTLFITGFLFLAFFYLFFANRLHYFLLANDGIVIKNYFKPWVYKNICLTKSLR